MSSFDFAGRPGAEPEPAIIDPADEHFDQSFADFAEYDQAINEGHYSIEDLVEPNSEPFGDRGNPLSLQGFDMYSFRDQS